MKSTLENLRKRGYATTEDIANLADLSKDELYFILHSSAAVMRSAAAYNLSPTDSRDVLELLIQLTVEKRLYTRIAICEVLEQGDSHTAVRMIEYLGLIGNNQHQDLPERVSDKVSYPLPRDIIARALGKMEPAVLPVLMRVTESGESVKIREVLDAIGFMVFYNPELATNTNFDSIIPLLTIYSQYPVMIWKIILCLSAFPLQECVLLLKEYATRTDIIGAEARRSLQILICDPEFKLAY